jgi:hypothetical protein
MKDRWRLPIQHLKYSLPKLAYFKVHVVRRAKRFETVHCRHDSCLEDH